MASTLKKFLPPGWEDVAEGEVIVKSASGVTGGSLNTTIAAESITNAEVSPTAAIDASKLADGSVSNTEFQYLNGVTSAIQSQLEKMPKSIHVSPNAGDVTKIAGHADLNVQATYPGDGQVRVTHSQGNTNFAVQVTFSRNVAGAPTLADAREVRVYVTSTYIDVWIYDINSFNPVDFTFFLTIFPY